MSSPTTHVFALNPKEGNQLADALHQAGFEFRTLQHALFQARGQEVVVSLYKSGKLVVQGRGAEAWHIRFLGAKEQAPLKQTKKLVEASALPATEDSLGSDEAGKGDTFGSLVVAAAAIPKEQVEIIKASKVADSKTLEDATIRVLAPWLRNRLDFEVCSLMPHVYNKEWQEAGRNVNHLLTRLHFDCLRALQARSGFRVAVVDRFSPSCPVRQRFHSIDSNMQVVEVPRAEAHLAVAVASVLARERFLCDLDELSKQWALDLPRGSGSPVPPALRQFLRIHGASKLHQVTKLHFKNVQRVLS